MLLQTPIPLRLSISGHTHSHQALQTQELIINRAEAGDPAVGGAGQRQAGSQQSSVWGGFMGCHHGAPADSKHTDTDRWRVETLKAQPTVPKAFPEASAASSLRQGSPCTTPLARLKQEGGQALRAQPWKCRVALVGSVGPRVYSHHTPFPAAPKDCPYQYFSYETNTNPVLRANKFRLSARPSDTSPQ